MKIDRISMKFLFTDIGYWWIRGHYFTYTEPKRADKEVNKVFADLYGFNLPSIRLTGINSTHYGVHNGVRKEVKIIGNI